MEAGFPVGVRDEDKQIYRKLQLTARLFEDFKAYWGGNKKKTIKIFADNNVYAFIMENHDFYHTVGGMCAVEDICECLNLPKGKWS